MVVESQLGSPSVQEESVGDVFRGGAGFEERGESEAVGEAVGAEEEREERECFVVELGVDVGREEEVPREEGDRVGNLIEHLAGKVGEGAAGVEQD